MNRREALAKATITTTTASAGLLDASQGNKFIRKLKDTTSLAQAMRQEVRTTSAGEINKIATGSRIIRGATENADDGYRAGATFATVPYTTKKIRLPWEVTEDVFHENIEGSGLEATITSEMTDQFALDMEDLEVNGDEDDVSGDAAFLAINDGIVKQVVDAAVSGRNIDGSTIDSGVFGKGHMFAMLDAMPNTYLNSGNLRWIIAPSRKYQWWESLTALETGAGDAALAGQSGLANAPLGIPFLEVASWPENTIFLADPRNFVRVISWEVRKRKVTGETDASLAALDKRFYIYFIKHDVIVEETDAVVRVHTLDAP